LRTSPATASQYFVTGSSAAESSSIALQTVTAHTRHRLLTADAFQSSSLSTGDVLGTQLPVPVADRPTAMSVDSTLASGATGGIPATALMRP